MLCKLFQTEMCLYEACKYYDMATNDCIYDSESKKRVLAKVYVAGLHSRSLTSMKRRQCNITNSSLHYNRRGKDGD